MFACCALAEFNDQLSTEAEMLLEDSFRLGRPDKILGLGRRGSSRRRPDCVHGSPVSCAWCADVGASSTSKLCWGCTLRGSSLMPGTRAGRGRYLCLVPRWTKEGAYCPCVLKAACCLSKDAHINLGDAQLASNPPGTPAALVSSICFPARFAATRPLRTFLCFGAARCACFAGGGNSKGTTCTRGGELDGMVAVVLWWRAHNSSEDTAAGKEAPSTSRAAGWLVTFGLFGSIRGRCFL
mmetsp:Transcript_27247/g.51895  ORF Transcript_27247/g.51895 Transcript_27247/m.51895 type:complete len:239 (-) Transcript_27247:335-1051(-)